MSFTAFIAAAVIFAVSWARGGTWARPLPMSVLALMDRSRFKSVGMTVRDEVDRRIDQGEFTPWSTTLLLHSLAKDLRSDERRFNAERGIDLLDKLWPQSRNELERSLSTGDAQSRILAARVLRKRCTTPTPALLKACVEDLRDDSIQVRWYLSLGNAREACDYLLEHAAAAEDLLVQAMRSEDRQQQLLSAAILGFANRVDQIDRAAPILIHHLRNNDIGGDAKIAAPALYRFGSAALPYLSAHIDSDDAQLRAAARSIVEQIEHPDRLIHELDNPMPRLSVLTHDPLNTQSLAEIAGDVRWPARQKR